MSDEQTSVPFVSVVVPVYNDERRIGLCLEALLAQTYPRERYEIIVVDNGSSDRTPTIIQRFPVTFLAENDVRSSFAARNKGLALAKGEIIASTDADCIPTPNWLAAAVETMQREGADLLGGNVRFMFSPRPTGAEIFDSMSNLRMEHGVRERGVVRTANLFVRRRVFDVIGTFPGHMQSGGDIFWTRLATTSGYKLSYAAAAEVAHPTRQLKELIKKQFRVGRGHNAIRATERSLGLRPQATGLSKGRELLRKVFAQVKSIIPVSLGTIRNDMKRHQLETPPVRVLRVWAACWLANVATTAGSLSMALSRQRQRRRPVDARVSHSEL